MWCTQHVSGITFIRYAPNRKIGKPNNLNFGSNKIKGPRQDSQYQVRSHMPEGRELLVLLIITLFKNCKFQSMIFLK